MFVKPSVSPSSMMVATGGIDEKNILPIGSSELAVGTADFPQPEIRQINVKRSNPAVFILLAVLSVKIHSKMWGPQGQAETGDAKSNMVKQGIEENVELCTTLGREDEEIHGQSKEIIETKPGTEATMRSHVLHFPEPAFPQNQPASNTPVVGRDSPPQTAATISSKDTRWTR